MHMRFLLGTAALAALCTLSNSVAAQSTATSVCTDGSTSSATGRGACSGHGGVDKKATAAAKKASGKTTVTCTDGTTSKSGRGACSSHGGIASAAAAAAPAAAPAAKPAPAPAPAPPPAPAPAAAPAPAPAPAPAAAPTASTTTASAPTAHTSSSKSENNDPTGATAKCKDGLYSHAAHRTGACSRHGGVAQWLTK